jgi:hypothetical protein
VSVLRSIGVLDDGTPRAPNVTANTAATLRMVQGASVTMVLTVVDNAGAPVDLVRLAAVCTLTVKVSSGYAPPVLTKTGGVVTPAQVGVVAFTIAPADTRLARLPNGPGRYVYDVWIAYGGNRYQVVPMSPFLIQPAVAQP